MDTYLFVTIVGLLGLACLWIGKRASAGIETSDDYYLMGRNLSFIPLTLSLLATQLGGGSLLGAAQEAYTKGWAVLFYPLGGSLGFIALGLGFGAALRRFDVATIAEIFEKVYRSKVLRRVASALSIVGLFIILAAQAIAAKKFFVSIGFGTPLTFVLFWSALVAYTVMGGLKAVVNTDIMQALFILTALAVSYLSIDTSTIDIAAAGSADVAVSDVPWVAWFFMPLLFMFIEQDMGQRCFAAKTPRVVSFAAMTAGVLLFLGSLVAIYLGILARDMGIVVAGDGSVLVEAITALTSPPVATLFIVAIFMAIISTADSLLCSIGSNVSYDFMASQQIEESAKVAWSRGTTCAVGLAALAIAFAFNDVIALLMFSYDLAVCVLFVPVTMSVLSSRPSIYSAYLAMIFGALGFVAFRVFDAPIPREVLTIALSSLGAAVGNLMAICVSTSDELEGCCDAS